MSRFPALLIGAVSAILAGAGTSYGQSLPAASPEFFESKIRPVLAASCYSCHTDSHLGGLRLDSLEAIQKGGKRGPALNPADPAKSLLLTAVQQTDPSLKMPMGGKLKDSEIADLEAWVKAGAVWPKSATSAAAPSGGKYVIAPERRQFWSFQPLRNPEPPSVKDARWNRTAIDRFVFAKLQAEGLAPVRPANKHDLLRRATLDLIGLAPAPEEYAAFENDNSPDAFPKVVDRLLASPHYGERWGRVWLDVARYGEDDYRSLDPMRRGYNPYPNAFVYRDWVIEAFNNDLPYDRFVKAQIAGDLLDPKTLYKTLPATGFLGLGPWYYDNGAVEVTHADERHDRVDVITRGMLGLTVACARCHDHKYDPIPQTDYYALAGVFYNTLYEEYPLAPRAVLAEFTRIEDELDKKESILQEMQSNLRSQLARSLAFQTSNYLQGVFEVGSQDKKIRKEFANVVEDRKLDYELLDRWVKYMAKPTGKYHNKDEWQAMVKKGGTVEEAKKLADKFQEQVVAVMLAKNDLDEENKVIEAKALEGTKKKKRTDKPSNFVTNDDFCPGCALELKNLPDQDSKFWTEIFLRELRDTDDPNAMMGPPGRMFKPGVLAFRGWGLEKRVGAEEQAQLKSIQSDIDEAKKKIEPYYPFAHGVKDSAKPENIQLALRGNPQTLGEEVPRHFLSILSQGDPKPFTQGSGRLELAEDIVRQPIAMRVIVNRIWKQHFGTGIVDTPSNFGFGGDRPSNPELLEYLASSFLSRGMSIKSLQREIMLTSVYQLGGEMNRADYDKDSANRFYWRANRKRMDAEQVRDTILQVAGNLDEGVGGPSQDLTPAFLRRTVYGKVSRYKLDAYLQLFDFPSPAISAEKRFTTTVPLQRLFLMNSDFMQIEAEELARRVAGEPDNRARIRKAYELAFGRQPTGQEVALGLTYLRAEPLREYEEIKKKADAAAAAPGADKPKDNGEEGPTTGEDGPGAAGADQMGMGQMGMGMMGGLMDGVKGKRGEPSSNPENRYEATAWGRYAKVLLSSSEFLYID